MTCDTCGEPARLLLYAAYDVDSGSTHPRVARYPEPMLRGCWSHLFPFLSVDLASPGSTRQYVLKVLG